MRADSLVCCAKPGEQVGKACGPRGAQAVDRETLDEFGVLGQACSMESSGEARGVESPPAPAHDPRWPRLHHVSRGLERFVRLLDSAVPIPGTRFRIGLDPVVGLLLPGTGDAVGGAVSLTLLFLALQYRLPVWVIARMVLNIGVDAAIGGIPVAGDVFDVVWKANEKNLLLIERHRVQPGARMPVRYWIAVTALLAAAVVCLVAPVVLVIWLASRWLH
jgi:hypothetical protein